MHGLKIVWLLCSIPEDGCDVEEGCDVGDVSGADTPAN